MKAKLITFKNILGRFLLGTLLNYTLCSRVTLRKPISTEPYFPSISTHFDYWIDNEGRNVEAADLQILL